MSLAYCAPCRPQEDTTWSFNRLFGRGDAAQELRKVSVEPDAHKKGHQNEQPRSGSLRDSGSLRHHKLISPRNRPNDDLDGTSTSAFEGLSTHRSSCYSDRRRWQAEEEDASRE